MRSSPRPERSPCLRLPRIVTECPPPELPLEFPAVFLPAARLPVPALEHACDGRRSAWGRRHDPPSALDFHSRMPLHILRALATVVSKFTDGSVLARGATFAR